MKIFLILITLIIATNLFAETNPPKVTTQQFQNWTYQCVEDKKIKTCEVSQNIRIQNSNINFSVVYNKFLNNTCIVNRLNLPSHLLPTYHFYHNGLLSPRADVLIERCYF